MDNLFAIMPLPSQDASTRLGIATNDAFVSDRRPGTCSSMF